MSLEESNQIIDRICRRIEELDALNKVFPGYPNDAIDVDKEECFVADEPEKPDDPYELAEYNQGIADWIKEGCL